MSGRSHEPTSPVKPLTRGRGDTRPPAPPRELDRGTAGERQFMAEDCSWVARIAGKGACGTGSYGLGLVDAVHFCDGAEPDVPLREALLAHGRFESLFDAELVNLLARATPIVTRDG